MILFTDEQIQSLAPDLASLRAGRDLAKPAKWPTLAHNNRVAWGEVQGSGSTPYRTQVDLADTAFKCSCPSRKFPCKHGLGLLTLLTREPALFGNNVPEPGWVSEWIEKRSEKAAKANVPDPATSTTAESTPANADRKRAKDQQKRADARQSSMKAGVAELDRWAEDLVRTGLLSMPDRGAAFWQKTAARMVDAKAPGLATRVKQLGNLNFFDGNGWQAEALRQLGQLHLLTTAFSRLDQLPADLQADVQAQLGLTVNQKDLLEDPNAPTLTDAFWVLARQTTQEDDLTIQRTYLYGEESGRFALVLNFAYKNTPIDTSLLPGTRIAGTLVFFPGRWLYRAVVKAQKLAPLPTDTPPNLPQSLANWQVAQQTLTDILTKSPWAEAVPQFVGPLTLVVDINRYFLRDEAGQSFALAKTWPTEAFYDWLALTGGQAATVFLLRHHAHVEPLGLWANGNYQSF